MTKNRNSIDIAYSVSSGNSIHLDGWVRSCGRVAKSLCLSIGLAIYITKTYQETFTITNSLTVQFYKFTCSGLVTHGSKGKGAPSRCLPRDLRILSGSQVSGPGVCICQSVEHRIIWIPRRLQWILFHGKRASQAPLCFYRWDTRQTLLLYLSNLGAFVRLKHKCILRSYQAMVLPPWFETF